MSKSKRNLEMREDITCIRYEMLDSLQNILFNWRLCEIVK